LLVAQIITRLNLTGTTEEPSRALRLGERLIMLLPSPRISSWLSARTGLSG
jgi:hypothetical protein